MPEQALFLHCVYSWNTPDVTKMESVHDDKSLERSTEENASIDIKEIAGELVVQFAFSLFDGKIRKEIYADMLANPGCSTSCSLELARHQPYACKIL